MAGRILVHAKALQWLSFLKLLVFLATWVTCFPLWAATREQQVFASPEEAAEALASAWRSGSTGALLALFGSDGAKLVRSGDPVGERIARSKLASAYRYAHRIENDGSGKAIIVLGKDDWPYPIPLVMQGTIWRFDTKAGAQQIVDRRIGHNEVHAINVCRTYVEAQLDYAASHHRADGRREFAQRITSSPGKHDGLFWRASGREDERPLGPFLAAADAQGYLPWLPLPRSDEAGKACARRRTRLRHRRAHDWWVLAACVSREIRCFWRDDIDRKSERHRL